MSQTFPFDRYWFSENADADPGSDPGFPAQIADLLDAGLWAIASVDATEAGGIIYPAYAYTVGLASLGHPELIVTGRMPDEAAELLNTLASGVKNGARLDAGDLWSAAGRDVFLVEVTDCHDWLEARVPHLGRGPARAIQLVWTDDEGALPWEQVIPDTLTQPVLGPPPGQAGWVLCA